MQDAGIWFRVYVGHGDGVAMSVEHLGLHILALNLFRNMSECDRTDFRSPPHWIWAVELTEILQRYWLVQMIWLNQFKHYHGPDCAWPE